MNIKTKQADTVVFKVRTLLTPDSDLSKDYFISGEADYLEHELEQYDQYRKGLALYYGAYVTIERWNQTQGVTVTYRSAGLWGIHEDAPPKHLQDTFRDEFDSIIDACPELLTLCPPISMEQCTVEFA